MGISPSDICPDHRIDQPPPLLDSPLLNIGAPFISRPIITAIFCWIRGESETLTAAIAAVAKEVRRHRLRRNNVRFLLRDGGRGRTLLRPSARPRPSIRPGPSFSRFSLAARLRLRDLIRTRMWMVSHFRSHERGPALAGDATLGLKFCYAFPISIFVCRSAALPPCAITRPLSLSWERWASGAASSGYCDRPSVHPSVASARPFLRPLPFPSSVLHLDHFTFLLRLLPPSAAAAVASMKEDSSLIQT